MSDIHARIASAGYAAYCLGTLAATVSTPRYGARAVAVAAGCLATAGTALIALSPTAVVLAVGVTIAGAGTGSASPPLAQAIAHKVAPARRDRVQTAVNAGTGLGVTISGPVALLADDHWRAAWFAFAAISAAVTVWVGSTVPKTFDDSTTSTGGTASRAPRPSPLPPGALRLLGAAAVVGAASAATWTFGRELLVEVGELGHTPATVAWIALGACGLLGAASGDLAKRIGLPRAWTTVMFAMCATTAILAAAPQQPALAVAASAAFGAVYIASTGILLIRSTHIYPSRPATGVGLAFLLLAIGQAAAAPAVGFLADRTSLTTAFWCSVGVALLGCALHPPRDDHPG